MARRKQNPREVDTTGGRDHAPVEAKPPELEASPLELAVPVSEVVQIRHVILSSSSIESDRAIFTEKSRYHVRIEIPSVEHTVDVENQTLVVIPSFALSALRGEDADQLPGLTIKASFLLEYSLPEAAEFEEKRLQAFARTNGVYNAWPYWREYVQSTTARMGLPPIIIPVFRLS